MATKNSQILGMKGGNDQLFIGWTTVADLSAAQHLASEMIRKQLAACAQVEGPITSYYMWEGQLESSSEYRITVKFVASQQAALCEWLHNNHPYQTPQWVAVPAAIASASYLEWACSTANSGNPKHQD